MFGHRYFGRCYFGPKYWGDGGSVSPATNAAGWEYAKRGRRRTDEELREARIRFGVIEVPEARAAMSDAVEAKERAAASVDTRAKLSAARAQLEAEEAYKRVYLAVYEDLLREEAAELFRAELAAELDQKSQALFQAKRRRAILLLLV